MKSPRWLAQTRGWFANRRALEPDAPVAPAPLPQRPPQTPGVSLEALQRARKVPATATSIFQPLGDAPNPFAAYKPAPGVVPKGDPILAMDDLGSWDPQQWARGNQISAASAEGQQFVGFPTLALLAQRPEYRILSEVMATEMVRKWITLKALDGSDKTTRIEKINEEFIRLGVRECFRKVAEQDGFFGRSHLFLDFGDTDDAEELKTSIGDGTEDDLNKAKIKKGSLKALNVIEAVWIYPQDYNAIYPLLGDWYKPRGWYVMGQMVHVTRLLTFINREVPDLLKPAYAFAGLSMSQMAIPYVINWLEIRQSVNDIIKAFSVFVLSTNATDVLAGGQGETFLNRLDLFNAIRDNRGVLAIDKDKEDFRNVAAPLGGLDHLQAQAQEHMCVQAGTLIETTRGQIAIEMLLTDDSVITRDGPAPIKWVGVTRHTSTLIEICAGLSVVRVTECHPVWSETAQQFVDAKNVDRSHRLLKSRAWGNMECPSRGAVVYGAQRRQAIYETQKREVSFIASCGWLIADLFQKVSIFTTGMRTEETTVGATSYFLTGQVTKLNTLKSSTTLFKRIAGNAESRLSRLLKLRNTVRTPAKFAHINCEADGSRFKTTSSNASIAATPLNPANLERGFVLGAACSALGRFQTAALSILNMKSPVRFAENCLSPRVPTNKHAHADAITVRSVREQKVERQPVYDIEVDGRPEFFANGILIHNSSVSRIPLVKLLGISPSGLNACVPGDTLILTNRGQIAIRDVTLRDKVWTRSGFAPLTFSGVTKHATDLIEISTLSETIRCTPNHPIWLPSINEFVAAENVQLEDRLLLIGDTHVTLNTRRPSLGAAYGGGEQSMAITPLTMPRESVGFFFIEQCGNIITDLSRMVSISTISTKIRNTIKSKTLSRCMASPIADIITLTSESAQFGPNQKQSFANNAGRRSSWKNYRVAKSFAATNASLLTDEQLSHPKLNPSRPAFALCAKLRSSRLVKTQNSVLENVRQLVRIAQDICKRIFARTRKSLLVKNEMKDGPSLEVCLESASDAGLSLFRPDESMKCIAQRHVKQEHARENIESVISIKMITASEAVYDLTVARGYLPEFVANGILVHNSSEGELQVFADHISATQEAFFRPNLTTILRIVQLSVFGDVDHQIGFDFGELVELTMQEEADLRKTNAETGEILVRAKAVASAEERSRVIKDKDGPYQDLDPKGEVEFPMTENEKADVAAKVATVVSTLVAEGIIQIPVALQELQAQAEITGFGEFITDDVIAEAEQTLEDMPDPAELAEMAANGGQSVGGGETGKPGVDPALAKTGEPGKKAPTPKGAMPARSIRPVRPEGTMGSKPIA